MRTKQQSRLEGGGPRGFLRKEGKVPQRRKGKVLGRSTGIVTERGESRVHVHSQGREQAGCPDRRHTREIAGHAGGEQEGLKPSPDAKTGGQWQCWPVPGPQEGRLPALLRAQQMADSMRTLLCEAPEGSEMEQRRVCGLTRDAKLEEE